MEDDMEVRRRDPRIALSRKRGINLEERGEEVKKILYSKFNNWMNTYGYNYEDVLQEVYLGILRRNQGECPWDASKASFGYYVYMVCSCVLSNYHRKKKRKYKNEVTGVKSLQGDSFEEGDLGDANSLLKEDAFEDTPKLARQRFLRWLDSYAMDEEMVKKAKEILPLVEAGFGKSDISRKKNWSLSYTSKVVDYLRDSAQRWYHF